MRPEDLVFWLDVLDGDPELSSGVLCRRCADAMVVPRNWTLDDLRDPDLHLFRPPEVVVPHAPSRRRSGGDRTGEQLRLGSFSDGSDGIEGSGGSDDQGSDVDDQGSPTQLPPPSTPDAEPTGTWTPEFDAGDDLDGLLSARSPLLARAFRGDDRPER